MVISLKIGKILNKYSYVKSETFTDLYGEGQLLTVATKMLAKFIKFERIVTLKLGCFTNYKVLHHRDLADLLPKLSWKLVVANLIHS